MCARDMTELTCLYSDSKFQDKKDLSKHNDRIHGGAGLLEGDKRQF